MPSLRKMNKFNQSFDLLNSRSQKLIDILDQAARIIHSL